MIKPFFRLASLKEARQRLLEFKTLSSETVDLDKGLDRTCASDIFSPEDLPPFNRSCMDGYAIRAKDSFGSSESEPSIFKLIGEIKMGEPATQQELLPGEAVKIWTGGILPPGADSVVMLEYVNELKDGTIEVYRSVAPGENVIKKGEDCKKGQKILKKGSVIRPQEIGLLAGLGITEIDVVKRPKVAIISTGDEIVPPWQKPPPGKIRDINSNSLFALCKKSGADPLRLGIVKDSPNELYTALKTGLSKGADIILVSGGSSVGNRDYTLEAFKRLSGNDPLLHGVAIRPGKPTIVSKLGNVALFGLPGHVSSCIVVYLLLVHFLIHKMSGLDPLKSLNVVKARCSEMIPSVIGRQDFVRVELKNDSDGNLVATPVYGKSGLISTLVKAQGLLIIPRDAEGLYQDETAEVILL